MTSVEERRTQESRAKALRAMAEHETEIVSAIPTLVVNGFVGAAMACCFAMGELAAARDEGTLDSIGSEESPDTQPESKPQ